MADDLFVLDDFRERVEECNKKLDPLHFAGKARPLFKEFREYSYEPEKCKNCEKLKLARKEGIEHKLIGWRLESPVGMFVLEGCNLRLYCSNKRRTFVIKCIPLNLREIEHAIDILECWLDGVTFEESEEEKIDEEKVQKAKETMRTLLLFNHQDKAEKILENYPFPEHFNDIFEAFTEVCPYGILGFPYRGIVKCTVKEKLLIEKGDTRGTVSSVEELYDLFFISPEDSFDLCYTEIRGSSLEFRFCFCIAKKCCDLRATPTLNLYANVYDIDERISEAMFFHTAFKKVKEYNLTRKILESVFLGKKLTKDQYGKLLKTVLVLGS